MEEKIKLGDILKSFEDAFYAGWYAGRLPSDQRKASKTEAFEAWIEQEVKKLKL